MNPGKWKALAAVLALISVTAPSISRGAAPRYPYDRPTRLTSEPDPVTAYTVSRDGRALYYLKTKWPFAEVWTKPADPSHPGPPVRVSDDSSEKRALSLSPDGKRLAYVSTGEDAKGDIWILDLDGKSPPLKLTSNDYADDSPSFSPDGEFVYYHRSPPGENRASLARVKTGGKNAPEEVFSGIDAREPAVSPGGGKIAFRSAGPGGKGGIFLLDLDSGTFLPIVEGLEIGGPPFFGSEDFIYFTRRLKARKGAENSSNRVIFKVSAKSGDDPLPLTSPARDSSQPMIAGERLYFLNETGGTPNVFVFGLEGDIRSAPDPESQKSRAQSLQLLHPPRPDLEYLAYARLHWLFPEWKNAGSAALNAARALYSAKFDEEAAAVYLTVDGPEDVRANAAIERAALTALMAKRGNVGEAELKKAVDDALNAILPYTLSPDTDTSNNAFTIEAMIRLDVSGTAEDIRAALRIFDMLLASETLSPGERAFCHYYYARALDEAGLAKEARQRYIFFLDNFPYNRDYSIEASDAIIDSATKEYLGSGPMEALRKISEDESHPALAAGALVRIGDLLYLEKETERAKEQYRRATKLSPDSAQGAAARLALAETLYREERFTEALALFESEAARHNILDQLYYRIRSAYVGKSLAAAERLLKRGELGEAKSIFREIADYDGQNVEALRGLVRAAAATGETEPLYREYLALSKKNPGYPGFYYLAGLSLSYRETEKAYKEALELVEKAIAINGRPYYFHQTAGYLKEALAAKGGGQAGDGGAGESYRMALYLSDRDINPDNYAALLMNLGNAAHRAGQDALARRYYGEALDAGLIFDDPDQEFAMRLRHAVSSFRAGFDTEAASLFKTALAKARELADPAGTIPAFDAFARYAMDRVARPAERLGFKGAAEAQASISELGGRMARLAREMPGPPPDPTWPGVKEGLGKIAADMEKMIGKDLKPLLRGPNAQRALSDLYAKAAFFRAALDRPDTYASRMAEIYARMGLALDQAGKWDEAAAAYGEAQKLNSRPGREEERELNLFSRAYALYREASKSSPGERLAMLEESRKLFLEAAENAGKEAGKKTKDGKGGGFINISTVVSLSPNDATEAARGFSPVQKKRAIGAFLGRIATELGELPEAEKILSGETALYPPGKPVAASDLLGVSVMYNRKGHLKAADGKWGESFDAFERSAALAADAGSGAGAATGVRNMALAWTKLPPPERVSRFSALSGADRAASKLLYSPELPSTLTFLAEYENSLGAALVSGMTPASSINEAAFSMALAERASSHLEKGIKLLGPGPYDGELNRLNATLNLNLALLCLKTGDAEGMEAYAGRALDRARESMGDNVARKALLLLGRNREALYEAENALPFGADAEEGELTGPITPEAADLLKNGDAEGAFELVSRAFEAENRLILAPYASPAPEPQAFGAIKAAAGRAELIGKLNARLKDDLPETKEALEREKALLESAAALPPWPQLKLARDREERDWAYGMLALALNALDNFDSPEKALGTKKLYREKFLARPGGDAPAPTGLPALFGARAPSAAELMAILPEDAAYLLSAPLEDGRILVLTLYPDGVEGLIAEDREEVKRPDAPRVFATVPDDFTLWPGAFRVFGPGHLYRSLAAEKPFLAKIARASLAEGKRADVLVLPNPVRLTATVPVREGKRPEPQIAFSDPAGKVISLASLFGPSEAPTAAIITASDRITQKLAVLLLARNGCPTVITRGKAKPVSDWPASRDELETTPDGYVIFGAGLMEPGRAALYAETKFAGYAEKGRRLFESGEYAKALKTFEEAGELMELHPGAKPHEEALLTYEREAAWLSGDIAGAARYATRLAEKIEGESPDSVSHADSLLKAGLIYARAGRYGESTRLLARAAEMFSLLGEDARYADALSDLGTVLENSGDYDLALENFGTAALAGGALGEKALLMRQYSNMGRILDLRLNRWPEALGYYEKALSIARDEGDADSVAQALLDAGRAMRLMGDLDGAEKYFTDSGGIVEKLPGDWRLKTAITLEKANNHWFKGEYQKALDLAGEASKVAARENLTLMRTAAENTTGLVWWTLGDLKRALSHLEDALKLAKEIPNRADEVASSLNNIGLVHRQAGDYPRAREYFEKALSMDRNAGSLWGTAYDLRNLGLNFILAGNPAEALPLLNEAVELTLRTGDRINEAKARFALALALERTGDADGANQSFEKARTLSRGMGLRETEWASAHGLARLTLSKGDVSGAEQLLENALSIIESMRAGIKVEELREGFIADKAEVYEDLVRLKADRGDAAGAFLAAERSRARNFIDLLGMRPIRAGGEAEEKFLSEVRRLKAREEELGTLAANAKNPEEESTYKAALLRLERDREELIYSMRAQNPELASMVSVEPSSEAEVRGMLDDSTVLAAYYLLPREIFIFTLSREKLSLARVPFPREALYADILETRRRIQNLEPVEELLSSLYDALVRPVEKELEGAGMLAIVPHGALHNLSFAALYNGRNYLIDDFPLFNLPGASVLRYTLARRPIEAGRRVLAVGNPDLGNEALSLPFAEQEVERIGWNFPEITVLTGRDATKAEVLKNIGDYGVIHIAGHGEFDPVNPLLSALMLGPGREGTGELSAAEIFGLELKADLVLLSACRTGLSKISGGDELIGLNRSFLYAGTHSVISSLWRVGDVSTAVLVKEFYRQYMKKDKAESLRAAMLHTKSLYPHPGYWGAFTLVGDYK